nr:MAG: homing endonuclease [Lokiarchaeota virus Ratatoskr Meg22_1012]
MIEPECSPSLSYILSNLIVGDGNVYVVKPSQFMIRMQSIDKEFTEEFRFHMQNVLRTFGKSNNPPIITVPRGTKNRKENYLVIFYSQAFHKWFKSKTTKELMCLCEKYPREFLISWFNSDGSVGIYNYRRKNRNSIGKYFSLILINTNKEWIDFAQYLLSKYFGIDTKIYERKKKREHYKRVYELRISKKEDKYNFYKKVGFTIIRKQRILEREFNRKIFLA